MSWLLPEDAVAEEEVDDNNFVGAAACRNVMGRRHIPISRQVIKAIFYTK